MSLIFEGRRITSPLTGAADETDFLVDNIGDVITIEIDVRFETYRTALSITDTNPESKPQIILTPDENQTGLEDDLRAIWISDTGTSWNDYNVGDQITVSGAANGANNKSANITEIIINFNNTRTLITDTTWTGEILPVGAKVAVTTPITAITHKHGFIGNDEFVNYISKVDGSEQIAQAGGLSFTNTTYQDATLLGNKSWQSGTVQIKGNNTGNGNPSLAAGIVQAFTIKHEFVLSPLMLADEWQDILNGIRPDRLLDEASLRYVFSIDAAPILKNPNNTTNLLFSEFTGNVGGKDENFNGTPTDYVISNVVYSDVLSGDITASLKLTTDETKITFTVTSTAVIPPFSDGNTKSILKFNFAPSSETQYRDDVAATSQTMEHNFMFDDVLSTLGSGSGTPRQFGTADQIIKSMTTTFVSSSVITVDVRVKKSSENVTRLSLFTDRRYQIYFSIANHALLRKDSDKASITIDNNLFFNDVSDPTLLLMANSFMPHTGSVVGTDNLSSISARVGDDICCITQFAIDKSGRETDIIRISAIKMQIIARKDASTYDVLDEYSTNLNLDYINTPSDGDIGDLDLTIDAGFATPVDDLRGNIRAKRRPDLDTGQTYSYELNLPIIMRWEYWEDRPSANSDFFDASEPNKGRNHDWARIAATTGWDIYYRATVSIIKNGNALPFTIETKIDLEDYLEGTEWNAENIKTFIDSTNDPIFDSPNYGVSLKENTRVQAEMTYLGADSYVPADLVSILRINAFERGNYKEQYTLSSLYPPHANTKWLGISPATMATITNPSGDIWRTAAILKASLLEGEDNWRVTQRMFNPPFTNVKLLSGGGTDKKEQSGGTTDKKLLS